MEGQEKEVGAATNAKEEDVPGNQDVIEIDQAKREMGCLYQT